MNFEHIINGWVAQLSLDARDQSAARPRREAPPASSPSPVFVETAAEAVAPIAPTAQAIVPTRPRGRLLPVLARAREGAARRAVVQPCLGLG